MRKSKNFEVNLAYHIGAYIALIICLIVPPEWPVLFVWGGIFTFSVLIQNHFALKKEDR